jgi:hypothetical protein
VILDEDLSRAHAEIRRGWDGVRLRDLRSKNGTRVDGARVGAEGIELHDGARIALGNVVMRFRDPAERHLRGEAAVEEAAGAAAAAKRPGRPGRPSDATPAAGQRQAAAAERSATGGRSSAATAPPRWIVPVALATALAAVAGLVWVLAS